MKLHDISNIYFIYIFFHTVFCSSEQCYYSNTTAYCKNGIIPEHIPDNITEIHLEDVDLETFRINSDKKYGNWLHIKLLDIQRNKGRVLHACSLGGLKKLQYLGVHGVVEKISNQAFRDLKNLLILNISGNKYLSASSLKETFVSKGDHLILPKLQTLILSGLYTLAPKALQLVECFRTIAVGRNITHIDISDTYVEYLDLKTFQPLCDSGLETLVAHRVRVAKLCIFNSECFKDKGVCTRLKSVDLSGLSTPYIGSKIRFLLTFNELAPVVALLYYVESVFLDNIITSPMAFRTFQVLHGHIFFYQVRKISWKKNHLQWLNASLYSSNLSATMRFLDVSHNILEYMSPDLLRKLENLRYLYLSTNRLYVMQKYHVEDFRELFAPLLYIKELNLSRNNLQNLPRDIFLRNSNLLRLDLSDNRLTDLTFRVSHLTALRVIVLKGNSFKVITAETRQKFDTMFSNVGASVDLSNNSFVCSCRPEHKATIQWLKMTKAIPATSGRYRCILQSTDSKFDILSTAEERTDRYCSNLYQRQVLSIALPTFSAVLVSILVAGLYARYRYKRKRTFKNVLEQLRNGEFPKQFLVFLTYCNVDTDLAIGSICPKLSEALKDIVRTEEELVCVGDRYFRPGFPIIDEAEGCIKRSAVVLAVVSHDFCESIWCEHELNEAFHANIPVVLLFTEHVNRLVMPSVVKRLFRNNVHASWVRDGCGDSGHPVPDWNILCIAIISLAVNCKRKLL